MGVSVRVHKVGSEAFGMISHRGSEVPVGFEVLKRDLGTNDYQKRNVQA